MQIVHRFGHVNDLSNIKAKEAAIRDAIDWISHWEIDVETGLKPTAESLRMVKAKLSKSLEGAA